MCMVECKAQLCNYFIGSLLHKTNFLMNTPRGDSNYRIKDFSLMEFRKEKCNEIDEKHKQRDEAIVSGVTSELSETSEDDVANGVPILEENVVDENAEAVQLMYQKTKLQERKEDFVLDSMSCYICQCNFNTIEQYEAHIEYHGDESEFQSLEKMEKFSTPMLQLSYQTCVDSHFFGFTLSTKLASLIVEKIIIVQSRQFYYVYNGRMPMPVPENGKLQFFVDSHVFMILREQPIVIGFSQTVDGVAKQHYVEQHHFMRTDVLPKPAFAVNPYRLSNKKTFKAKIKLDRARPPTEVIKALKNADAQNGLAAYDKHFRSYYESGRKLSYENMSGALKTLLQVEDVEQIQHYVSLKQSNVELHQFGRDLSVRINTYGRNASLEDVLCPSDDVLIINERVTNGSGGAGGSNIRQVLENNNVVLDIALMDFRAIIDWARNLDQRFGPVDKTKHEPRVYFARVVGVFGQRVNITCERKLPENERFTLIFRPLRSIMRYQYRALQALETINHTHAKRLLYPELPRTETKPLEAKLQLANPLIASNPEQLQAVQQIALSEKLPGPYIIFGPPGTGKTATVCEAIYQLFVRRPETHILVLAGSNTACDEVALRLLRIIEKMPDTAPHPLTRIFSVTCDRRIDNIDDLLLEHSNMYALHFYPDVQTIHEYRIVVCTLSLAGKLSTGGFAISDNGQSVFTHVFVDEAAASTESEVLMGITCTISSNTNIILSGDHKQLGPVLQSHRANEWGLSLSLMERLLQRECYQVAPDGTYNVTLQTRLRRNFRSHPEIVALYNYLYYDNELMAHAPSKNVCLVQEWFYNPNSEFPILFHSVFGTVSKCSMSMCNNKEIDAVMDYVKDLMYFGINGEKISQTDIGIISPYKSQYQRIQEQLNMRNWQQIDCGSVELFQGKEKQIIIVSFVRSFTPGLGFLDNTRRLNVLLSRPMSLLILIGNPRTLSQNKDFLYIIEKCRKNRTLIGSPYFKDDNDNEISIEGRIKNLQIGKWPTPKPASNNKSSKGTEDSAVVLGQSVKKKTSRTQSFKPLKGYSYNKQQLLQCNPKNNENTKSEIDQLFDELPKVPSDLKSDCNKSNKTQKSTSSGMQNGSISYTPVSSINNAINGPVLIPGATKPSVTGFKKASTIVNGNPLGFSNASTATSSALNNSTSGTTTYSSVQGSGIYRPSNDSIIYRPIPHTVLSPTRPELISSANTRSIVTAGVDSSSRYRYVPTDVNRFESTRPNEIHHPPLDNGWRRSSNSYTSGSNPSGSNGGSSQGKNKNRCVMM
ncbi:uncharacterized protein LOC115632864 isoform X2 [Scaptodrosophila lebanonensis]|uniref:Uncharacterized protein LOC115632864 isoform X2 n=1 Tax=Drosophila lebanonensis TaxID=7225 RepID=A0A6J2UBZ1_DROLE|nr:uncharacterized protein LOC115632864 isoform X2 [Scaptodrosophila lebanonensis]